MLMPRDDITGTSARGKQEIYRQSSNITQSTQKCLMKQLCSKYSYVLLTNAVYVVFWQGCIAIALYRLYSDDIHLFHIIVQISG